MIPVNDGQNRVIFKNQLFYIRILLRIETFSTRAQYVSDSRRMKPVQPSPHVRDHSSDHEHFRLLHEIFSNYETNVFIVLFISNKCHQLSDLEFF